MGEEVGCCSGAVCVGDPCQELAGLSRALPAQGFPVLRDWCWHSDELLEPIPLPCTSPRAAGKQQPHPPCSPPEMGIPPSATSTPGLSTHTNHTGRKSWGLCLPAGFRGRGCASRAEERRANTGAGVTEPHLSHGRVLPVPTDGDTGHSPAPAREAAQEIWDQGSSHDQPLLPLHPHEQSTQLSPHLFTSCSTTSESKISEPKPCLEFKVCFFDMDLHGDLRTLPCPCPSCQGKGHFSLTWRRD